MTTTINGLDDRIDLASGVDTNVASKGVIPLFTGAAQVCADSAPSLVASIKKYEVVALTDTGLTTFVVGTHNASQAVIASQPCDAIGKQIPYWNAGSFNNAALIWPVNAALDSLAKRKAFLNGTMLLVGHTI